MAVRKVVVLIVVSKCELHYLASCNRKYMYSSYLLGSIFFTSFCEYVKWESGNKWVFLTTSQGMVREF